MIASRRKFISNALCLISGGFLLKSNTFQEAPGIMTVNGWINADKIGLSLIHEHVMVDFIGADHVSPSRYNPKEVFNTALPKLLQLQKKGFKTLFECTPAYLGRDVKLLKQLAQASGLNIITNTGYYGAVNGKYFPAYAHTETAKQLADRWIEEWENGIEGSGIKPGFIKSGVDKLPFSVTQVKVIEAAAITHLKTGLTIGIHTGDGEAALEEKRIIEANGVSCAAWIWIHAQNEKNYEYHLKVARAGGWVSYDGVNKESIEDCILFLKAMKKENLLHKVLLSHDSGWYNVGTAGGGIYNGYTTIPDKLLPAMKKNGFTEKDIYQLLVLNPAKAFAVGVKRRLY